MKKNNFFSALFLAIIVSIFLSCKTAHFESHQKKMELLGNPSTGFSWEYSVEDENLIQIDEDIQYLGAEGVVGAPSLYTYTINSVSPGKTRVRFEYKRSWEKQVAQQVRLYEVTVKNNGKISLAEKKAE